MGLRTFWDNFEWDELPNSLGNTTLCGRTILKHTNIIQVHTAQFCSLFGVRIYTSQVYCLSNLLTCSLNVIFTWRSSC